MRKLRYAGAVIAGGIFLLGATPAQADLFPGSGTAKQQRGNVPIGGLGGGSLSGHSLFGGGGLGGGGLGGGGLLGGGLLGGGLLGGGLLGGGLLGGGLSPSAGAAPSFTQRPTARQSEAFQGGLPLLGGLGGLLPVNSLARAGTGPDGAGLPAGGTPVRPGRPRPAFTPAISAPTTPQVKPPTTADDPRRPAEPTPGESSSRRPFTADSRPIAGIDPDYK